jgi:shikimate 5-dehydrogenase
MARQGTNDELLASMPPGSLIANATGMGKDRPGSPISTGSLFPKHSLVWEFNYRGDLPFLQHARAQEVARGLTVTDGWAYFVAGWLTVMGTVFAVPVDQGIEEIFRRAADRIRLTEV